jgi:hypothetical protein
MATFPCAPSWAGLWRMVKRGYCTKTASPGESCSDGEIGLTAPGLAAIRLDHESRC